MENVRYHDRTVVQIAVPKPRFPALPYLSSQSGLVYDDRMRNHAEPLPLHDVDDPHLEQPARISAIYQELVSAGLVYDYDDSSRPSKYQLARIDARQATAEEISVVHSREHYEWVRTLQGKTNEELHKIGETFDSIYLNRATWLCASLSAGGAIEACKEVVAGRVKNSIAVVRPPGHHAEHDTSRGFCIFNNASIAAKVCQRDFPDLCRKILIVDWDIHHGNGIQEAFYKDPNVLYISLHVHRDGDFYPYSDYGDHLHCGESAGLGKNVNIPWSDVGMSDGDYMFAFQHVVMPIATEFDPDFVIVSAGFDAAAGDPLGRCFVSPAGYAHMTHMLMSLAKGKITVCLEGGYNLVAFSKSALAVTRTLMGEPPDRLVSNEASPSGIDTVHKVVRQQSTFWKYILPRKIVIDPGEPKGERMHDVVRALQSDEFFKKYNMMPLFIHRKKISKSFINQVLATSNYRESRPLLVVFRGPPEVVGIPDPRTNMLELHNIYMTDSTKTYLEWAATNDFAMIDVNIPKHVTDVERQDELGYAEADKANVRADATKELALYLWENYIECVSATHVFFLGVGDAYKGLTDLLNTNENCADRITYVVNFVAASTAFQGVKGNSNEQLSSWYYQHSLIFLANDHSAWDPEYVRTIRRKKYGKLVQSPFKTLKRMMEEHKSQVFELLLEETQDWRENVKTERKITRDGTTGTRETALRLSERSKRASSAPLKVNGHGS
ncbi:histone deacetylase [Cryomyces antarcticus]